LFETSPRFPQERKRAVFIVLTVLAILFLVTWLLPFQRRAFGDMQEVGSPDSPLRSNLSLSPISIDYPEGGSIFPPGITPPTFLWRDAVATSWSIDISFGDKAPPIHALSKGERLNIGAIDPECVSDTNEPPKLTPQQAASWTWIPDQATWSAIQLHSAGRTATLTITGYRDAQIKSSQSHITFSTSVDPVGAPIFYRDVPLMPTEGVNGTVQPLAPMAIHLIQWRLRDIRQSESRTVLKEMHTCANCHSFSADGKTMGMDIDGPSNDKGLYALVAVQRHISIQNRDIVQWNTDGRAGKTRVGFMSQVSPNGQYVVSTFAGPNLEISNSYYVTNFKDYHFLQVFYPTRGILEWYSRATGRRQPLPGADDPHYVQTDGVWSPDGKYIVFARAVARDPNPEGQKPASHANDGNETPIQYDLYRLPFNGGRGGTAERIVGASQNGMSNNFPKVSPDGRWIVFVQCHNGQLMRPDSQLFIVPFGGGVARRLRANTPLMNSWHSFSPNGRWLVFSSKARSPYTQMYLTHIDSNGNDSPAILIDNATAANRAVNIPEFVNIAGDGIGDIQVPAANLYKLMEQARQFGEQGDADQALATWKEALAIAPNDPQVQNSLGMAYFIHGDVAEALEHLRQAIRINPQFAEGHYNLGMSLLHLGHPDQALPELETDVTLEPRDASGEEAVAVVNDELGNSSEALNHWRKALAIEPRRSSALVGMAWLLATNPDPALRNGPEAVALATRAKDLAPGGDPIVLDTLAAAYAETGQFLRAITIANRALDLAVERKDESLANAIRRRILLYGTNAPFRDQTSSNAAQPAKTGAQ
jgi:tetratricopeptide (TPR) repeat protein